MSNQLWVKLNTEKLNNMKKTFVDLENTRYDDQRDVMREIENAEHCPFCMENLKKYHKQPIIDEGDYWIVTPNQWPYKNTKVHLLLILKKHGENLEDISSEAAAELFELATKMSTKYAVKGGALALRFGDTNYSAGTVNHIHVQFIQPDITTPNFKPVRIKLGKG